MNIFLWLAILLLILWVIAKVALTITGVFLHVLWIIAVISFVVWVIGKIRK